MYALGRFNCQVHPWPRVLLLTTRRSQTPRAAAQGRHVSSIRRALHKPPSPPTIRRPPELCTSVPLQLLCCLPVSGAAVATRVLRSWRAAAISNPSTRVAHRAIRPSVVVFYSWMNAFASLQYWRLPQRDNCWMHHDLWSFVPRIPSTAKPVVDASQIRKK
jgi:hypothetical protein